MTRLIISEDVTYEVDLPDETPYDAMRRFLDDPSAYLTAVTDRWVKVDDPNMTPEELMAAQEEVQRAEMDA